MRVGFAIRDITPKPGITLSGFASRCNRPSTGVDDPIFVHALGAEDGGELVLLLVFDLLALGEEITAEISSAVRSITAGADSQVNVAMCCTHTHSAPATIKLIGCGIPDRDYWDLVVKASVEAAREALAHLRPATLRHLAVPVAGVSYNRRALLDDGRVVMGCKPAGTVVKTGPTWDRLLLVRFDDEEGKGIVGIANWAAHACVVCTQNISSDFPGELRRRLSESLGVPFIYLQGACGNINLPYNKMIREEMLENVDALMKQISNAAWPPARRVFSSGLLRRTLRLPYAPVPRAEELEAFRNGMAMISRTGSGPDAVMSTLKNILNVAPGDQPDPEMMMYIAGALRQWSQELMEQYAELPNGCDLALQVWKLDPLVFCFIAAEVFSETAIQLQRAFPDKLVSVAGYGSPLVGYLPTDEALDDGGYEAAYAYRFYGRPAPFARGAERAVVEALMEMVRSGGTEPR
jgi:hypothetical protein